MKRKSCHWFSAITFVLIGTVLFLIVQNILTPFGQDRYGGTECAIRSFRNLDKNTVDVLFLGSSLVYNGISPMKIYEDSRIVSYSLASSAQPIEVSYCLLKDTYDRQKPKVVFIEASRLFNSNADEPDPDVSSSYWRCVMDVLPFGRTKIEMAGLYDQNDFSEGQMSVFIPIVKYHDRWRELTREDFSYQSVPFDWTMGEMLYPGVVPSGSTPDEVAYWTGELENKKLGTITSIENGELLERELTEPVYERRLDLNGVEYLTKMKDLCEKNRAELVLFKVPTNYLPQYIWSKEMSEETARVAEEIGVQYIDFTYEDTGINYMIDTLDQGKHLNSRGANKMSSVISDYLRTQYGIAGDACSAYDNALKKYQQVYPILYLESETEFSNYLKLLKENYNNMTVCLAACSDYISGLTEEDYLLLKDLGLKLVDKGNFMDSYLAVISGGQLTYEALSDREISNTVSAVGMEIDLVSAGWLVGAQMSIRVDGNEYGINNQGLNIVCIDNSTGLVVDSVCFDTHFPEKNCYRDYLADYNSLTEYCKSKFSEVKK